MRRCNARFGSAAAAYSASCFGACRPVGAAQRCPAALTHPAVMEVGKRTQPLATKSVAAYVLAFFILVFLDSSRWTAGQEQAADKNGFFSKGESCCAVWCPVTGPQAG